MSSKRARLPEGSKTKITIICTEEQEKHIMNCGCIACNDDICDCAYCDRCAYSSDNIDFKRPEHIDNVEPKRIAHIEYAVEVYDKNDRFVRQIIVFDLYTKAEEFMKICDEELIDGEYLGILAIFYDENGNEIRTERL